MKTENNRTGLKVLIDDNRYETAFLVGAYLEEDGHSAVVAANNLSLQFLNEGRRYFDVIIQDLDAFIRNNIFASYHIVEKTSKSIMCLIANFLKDIRQRGQLSPEQLGKRISALKKTGFLGVSFPKGARLSKIVSLFESGIFCPPYSYLEAVTAICSAKEELEHLMSSIEDQFEPHKGKTERADTMALIDVLYQKRIEDMGKILSPQNSNA